MWEHFGPQQLLATQLAAGVRSLQCPSLPGQCNDRTPAAANWGDSNCWGSQCSHMVFCSCGNFTSRLGLMFNGAILEQATLLIDAHSYRTCTCIFSFSSHSSSSSPPSLLGVEGKVHISATDMGSQHKQSWWVEHWSMRVGILAGGLISIDVKM